MGSHRYRVPAEIDIPEFDAEHRDLYRHLADLQHALTQEASDDRLSELLAGVVEHAHDHFAHEERVFRSAAYPSFQWHKKQHDTGKKRLQSAVRRFKSGDRQVLADLLGFFERWLPDHIAVADCMAAAYLRNFERSRLRSTAGYRPPQARLAASAQR